MSIHMSYREKLMLRMRRMVGRKRIFFKNINLVRGGAMEEDTKGGNVASIVVAKHTTRITRAQKPATRLVMSFSPRSRVEDNLFRPELALHY